MILPGYAFPPLLGTQKTDAHLSWTHCLNCITKCLLRGSEIRNPIIYKRNTSKIKKITPFFRGVLEIVIALCILMSLAYFEAMEVCYALLCE